MTYKGELVEPYKDDVEKDHETIRGKDITAAIPIIG